MFLTLFTLTGPGRNRSYVPYFRDLRPESVQDCAGASWGPLIDLRHTKLSLLSPPGHTQLAQSEGPWTTPLSQLKSISELFHFGANHPAPPCPPVDTVVARLKLV